VPKYASLHMRGSLPVRVLIPSNRGDLGAVPLVPLAAEAGVPMTHLGMAFTIAHPGVTCALLGARTEAHLDDMLAGLNVTLSEDVLDRIDEIRPAR
jgi:aryl-alcohol dehydrogenase-like predicted oxidoreductase